MNLENENYKKGWEIAFIIFSLIYTGIAYLYNYGTINNHLLITLIIAIPLILGWVFLYLLKKDKVKRGICSFFSYFLYHMFFYFYFVFFWHISLG